MDRFNTIYYEISGICNAKCPYCLSGRYKTAGGKFVTPDSFSSTIEIICKNNLLNTGGVIGLYNWGEPFLHPNLTEMLHIMNDYGLPYGFSTNASRVPVINDNFTRGLRYIIFSMPGFSQKSYNRIHGFSFETILSNIATVVQRCRQHGFTGHFSIAYHVYQFNLDEMFRCAEFAAEWAIDFSPTYAILNNWWHMNALLDNSLDYSLLRNVSEELFCFDIREKTSEAPKQYLCPQYNWLAIDEVSNLLICCQVPPGKDFSCGNLLTDDISSMLECRRNNSICKECISKGLAHYWNNSLNVPAFYLEATRQQHLGQRGKGVRNANVSDIARSINRILSPLIRQRLLKR